MDVTAVLIGAFGVGSLTLTFVKYTLDRRKFENANNQL